MSEEQPLQPRVKSLLVSEIATSWFTATLHEVSYKEREQYVRILRKHFEDSFKEKASLQQRAANILIGAAAPVKALRDQDEPDQEELKRAEEFLNEEKRRVMLERLAHDAKHEGLEALLAKVEFTIWGKSA